MRGSGGQRRQRGQVLTAGRALSRILEPALPFGQYGAGAADIVSDQFGNGGCSVPVVTA